MYSTCIHCFSRLQSNEAVEAMPVGRRIALAVAAFADRLLISPEIESRLQHLRNEQDTGATPVSEPPDQS